MDPAAERRLGTLAGFGAYGLWGVLPLVFHALRDVAAFEILLHRIVWSFVVVVALLAVRHRLAELRGLLRDRRSRTLLFVAAGLISLNWLTYIWAVATDRVLDAALGYYINPLLTVAVGVVVLSERLRRAQVIALGLGAIAVVVMTVARGVLPWVSLVLACTFAGYGFLKKSAGAASIPSLAVETLLLTPVATAAMVGLALRGDLSFTNGAVARDVGLVGLGVVTALPLLLFATAATRIPLSQLGLLQYTAPTLQFLLGALVFHEHLPAERVVGFVLVWVALVILTVDAVQADRRARRVVAEVA